MTLNHRKSIKLLYPYWVFPFWYDMQSRDATVLIDFLRFNVIHYSSTFFFNLLAMVPTLVENS